MNIVQLHERVRFWVDVVSSTRFDWLDIDQALNITIDNKVRESYDQNRPLNKSDSFQRVQRIRDELNILVKPLTIGNGLTLTGNKITIDSSVTDYGWQLSLSIKETGGSNFRDVFPLPLNRKSRNISNPFRRVKLTPVPKSYYYEENGGIILDHPFDSISDVEIYYLARPATVYYGYEQGVGWTPGLGEDIDVIVVEEMHMNSMAYKMGTELQMTYPDQILQGLIVYNFVNSELPDTLHEEISRRAAINLLMVGKEFDKAAELRKEIMAS